MILNVDLCSKKSRTCQMLTCAPTMAVSDYFDNLPDPVVLLIFNRLADIKALGRCCSVSKRFRELVLLVDNVLVKVDCVISGEDNCINVKGKGILSHLMRFVFGSIVKPLQALHQFLGPKKSILADVSHHSPCEVLKHFKELQRLRIELPGGELGMEGGLLKWKAEFGSTIDTCVILGAVSMVENKSSDDSQCDICPTTVQPLSAHLQGEDGSRECESCFYDEGGSIPESFYTDGGLKLRVVWTISSLIAASARHYLLQQIISDHPTLESLVLTDAEGQGMLCMNKEQLLEFRDKPLAASSSANRTQVPALNMKLRYAPSLDLPGGVALRGATLVTIRPSEHAPERMAEEFLSGAFEEPFMTAVNLLMKRKTYLLEMNSF